MGEYFVGILLISVAEASLSTKFIRSNWQLTKKFILVLLTALLYGYAFFVIYDMKGSQEWSHLSSPIRGALTYFRQVEPIFIQKNPTVILPFPIQSAYDFTGLRRERFLNLLGNQSKPRQTLQVGCIAGDSRACSAAGAFLLLLSEAGWPIDGNRVVQATAQIPSSGITFLHHIENPRKDLPPFLGTYRKLSASDVTLWQAVRTMGMTVGSANMNELPDSVIGVYFGSEPNLHVLTAQDFRDIFQTFEIQDARKIQVFLENSGLAPSLAERWRLSWPEERQDLIKQFAAEIRAFLI